jgi:small subunit ribosomal protein S4e
MHLKRQKAPKNWPITRKGTTFVVRPLSNPDKGVPILVVLRDMLKKATDRSEVRKIIHDKNVLMNTKAVKDEKKSVSLFDKITIVPSNEHYEMTLSRLGKFSVEEIKESEANQKIAKVVNKKMLKGKKVQLNLSDGRNYITDSKCQIGDSAIIDFKENKIKRFLPLQEKKKVIVFAGKHFGEKGIIDKVNSEKNTVELSTDDGKINVLIKQIMVIE